jgi:PBSX family phage terminase large subunit
MASEADLTSLIGYADMLEELHKKFSPHAKQIPIARDLFFGGVKRQMLCLGRRTGKSALICYVSVRWALTRPNSQVYIIGPLSVTQREIVFSSGLLMGMIPRKYLSDYNKTEARVTFTNGSFIKVLGADNPETLRGIRASLATVDELKDIKKEVIDIITPTLIDEDAPLILCGTPPEVAEHPFWEFVQEAKDSPDWAYYHGTSYDNPHLKKEVLDKERAAYTKRGDEDVFAREFLAQYVPGGKRAVFPMLTPAHVLPWTALWNRIQRTAHQWTYYVTLDPGTASCFAATIHAINPYRGLLYVMDEVYEQQQNETSIGKIWPRIATKMRELYVPEFDEAPWTVTVDEAATWARNELLDQFDVASMPTTKAAHRKSDGISVIKDLLRTNSKMLLSDRCVNTYKEMAAYMLDRQGHYVKKNDHAIDTLRYTLAAANYSFQESDAPNPREPVPEDERKRAYTVEEDLREAFGPIEEPYLLDFLD